MRSAMTTTATSPGAGAPRGRSAGKPRLDRSTIITAGLELAAAPGGRIKVLVDPSR